MPATVAAGTGLSVPTSGSGSATLYLFGPGSAVKRQVQLGQDIQLSADELQNAGHYTVVIGDDSASFFVTAGPVSSIAFLARPSRVPAATPNVISGTAFLFDKYQNLVLQPQPVKFDLTVDGQTTSRTETSKGGVAYTKLDSSKKEGPAQFVASSGDVSVRRVVQQVASDPCSIRMTAQPNKTGILVRTDPIHDCSGNPFPTEPSSPLRQPIRRARAQSMRASSGALPRRNLPALNSATISVASGVVVGNEIQWRGGQ